MKILLKEKQFKNIINIFLNESLSDMKKKYRNDGINNEEIEKYTNLYQKYKNSNNINFKLKNNYLDNIMDSNLRNNIDNFKDFEKLKLFIDYIDRQNYNKNDFDANLIDSETLIENDKIVIQRANTPKGCVEIKGGFDVRWCVFMNEGNEYYYYRLSEEETTFYFVKNVDLLNSDIVKRTFSFKFLEKSLKYCFFVIQVLKNGKYIVTSAKNDGDITMTWDEIINIFPDINDYKNIFTHKKLTSDEKKFITKLSDKEYSELSIKDKLIYISKNYLTDEMFINHTPLKIIHSYINQGNELTYKQKEYLEFNEHPKYVEEFKNYERMVGVTFFKTGIILDDSIFYDNFIKFFEKYTKDIMIRKNIDQTKSNFKSVLSNVIYNLNKTNILKLNELLGKNFLFYIIFNTDEYVINYLIEEYGIDIDIDIFYNLSDTQIINYIKLMIDDNSEIPNDILDGIHNDKYIFNKYKNICSEKLFKNISSIYGFDDYLSEYLYDMFFQTTTISEYINDLYDLYDNNYFSNVERYIKIIYSNEDLKKLFLNNYDIIYFFHIKNKIPINDYTYLSVENLKKFINDGGIIKEEQLYYLKNDEILEYRELYNLYMKKRKFD